MTHANHLTNGASLEDCHTNFFALSTVRTTCLNQRVLRDPTTGDKMVLPSVEAVGNNPRSASKQQCCNVTSLRARHK
ncbi:hypothetical protein J437_LFUL005480 [Ladona fulva]|uniref:Uncharacterized protein n=1 Tax=Ladona fulva TaxID=123851 RepID=A0A8K0JWV0_LADFU|nr:hypothetical protein J437_LFUL005480 [Ladona fulva]